MTQDKMARAIYRAPVVVPLGRMAVGSGQCEQGSSEAGGKCESGGIAGGGTTCENGGSNQAKCEAGSQGPTPEGNSTDGQGQELPGFIW